MTHLSNGQFVPPSALLSPRPLSLCIDTQIKFHFLLEDGEGRHLSTLEYRPLQFIPQGQNITNLDGTDFQHPLRNQIWNLVVRCKTLGDGNMAMVNVPFNDRTGNYDWKSKAMKKGFLWVRIFEVNHTRVAEAEDIKASLDTVRKAYEYWQKVHSAVWHDPGRFEAFDEYWEKAPGYVDRMLVEARGRFAEACIAWMKPTGSDKK
ncbi:hypothetical protein BGZ60DRAFT_400473 [Tricladium varicosporioides]|nr:hypothetical protein BGZ60DRAFT_400473 [Hymenoscyphus varicosporioides]